MPAAQGRSRSEPSSHDWGTVTVVFSDEHEELRRILRGFFADKASEAEVRRVMDTPQGFDSSLWRLMADQLGLPGLAVPEEFGGAGFDSLALTVAFEEMGRALLCAPFFSSVAMAATLLRVGGDREAQRDYLAQIASGTMIATVALAEGAGRWDPAGISMTAARSAGQWSLTGEKTYVLDGCSADLILVVARTPSGLSVFAVEASARTFIAKPLSTLDPTRKQARLVFDSTPARLVGAEGSGWTPVSMMLDHAAICLAAEQVGGAQKMLETTIEYARSRSQFGQLIGSFQVIKHRCAELAVDLEAAKAALLYASWAAAEGADDLPSAASLAKIRCSEVCSRTVLETIQIHGAIGFTWEHPAQLYFRRAKSSELFLGDPSFHRALLAQHSGI